VIVGLALGAVIGLAAGLGFHLLRRADVRTAEARLADLQAAHGATTAELERVRSSWVASEAARAALDAEVVQVRRMAEEREGDRKNIEGAFAELSRQALDQSNNTFLKLADQRMKQAEESASGALTRMVEPLRETLGKYQEQLRELEKDRQGAYAGLTTTVTALRQSQEQLQRETRNLVTALRSPQTRGRWGEVQLRRVVEMAGMLLHCDFDEQVVVTGDDGRLRPDMIVHMPGGGEIVVDAKVPLDAYLRVIEADDDESRAAGLLAHSRQVRAHVDQMAKREYWRHVPGSAEQVVVFVPGDALLSAAYEHDPGLQEYAMSNGVLLTTPTTLIALLRTVAFGWRQEDLAESAKEVQKLGNQLYDRIRIMGDHLAKVQRNLTSTVNSFNDAVSSYETRLLVTARKFPDLGVGGGDALPELGMVEAVPKLPQAEELPPAETS
jgi:DNA recombination protein RmuC